MLLCVPFNILFGGLLFCLMMFYLITPYIQKSMIIPCLLFNLISGRSAILSDDVLFDHNEHSHAHDATMHDI